MESAGSLERVSPTATPRRSTISGLHYVTLRFLRFPKWITARSTMMRTTRNKLRKALALASDMVSLITCLAYTVIHYCMFTDCMFPHYMQVCTGHLIRHVCRQPGQAWEATTWHCRDRWLDTHRYVIRGMIQTACFKRPDDHVPVLYLSEVWYRQRDDHVPVLYLSEFKSLVYAVLCCHGCSVFDM